MLKIFGKSDSKVPKGDSKVPKVVGGGQAILEKYHKKAIFFNEGFPKWRRTYEARIIGMTNQGTPIVSR